MENDNRIVHHPVLGDVTKRKSITFSFNQKAMCGYEGETIAAALLASGIRTLRRQEESGAPRGIYCNIGHCYECRVSVDGQSGVRACLTTIEEGMEVLSGEKLPTPFKKEGEPVC